MKGRHNVMPTRSEQRRSDLNDLRSTNPNRIIELYNAIGGAHTDGQVPYGVAFVTMIDAIVAFESQREMVGRPES
jgi:hypothetical protein